MGRVHLGKTNKHPLLGNPVNPKDFKPLTDSQSYKYYKENGGKLSFERYKSNKKMIFLKLMEHVLFKGKRMDIPYFGELFIQETKVPVREEKNNIAKNDHHIAELILQRYNHSRTPMNFYQDMEITLNVDQRTQDAYECKVRGERFRINYIRPHKDRVQRTAVKAKRKDKTVKFVKSFKQHEDYVYPENLK